MTGIVLNVVDVKENLHDFTKFARGGNDKNRLSNGFIVMPKTDEEEARDMVIKDNQSKGKHTKLSDL